MDVAIRCVCPGAEVRHPDGDTVSLKDVLDFRSATAIRKGLGFAESNDPDGRASEVLAILTENYLLFGIAGWTLVDERGKPIPVSHAAIRELLLGQLDVAGVMADAADVLYHEVILLPLLARASTSSPPTPINGSTSRQTGSSRTRPRPSRPSSTTTSPTGGTETTSSSLAGVSNSSLNSESAA